MRSDTTPQTWRLITPAPSSTDSIAAPTVAEMPRSLHSATRWPCGIDMVTQHMNEAIAISANTTLGGQPSTLRFEAAPLLCAAAAGTAGGGRKNQAASGRISAACTIA